MPMIWIPLAWCLLAVVSLNGCNHTHDHKDEHAHAAEGHDKDHGHGHGDGPTVGITRWTDDLELFAEHPPAVVGREVPFLAHVTILDGFRAVEEGHVVLELDGPERLDAKAPEKLRSGIFQPVFTPKKAGTYKARLLLSTPEMKATVDGFQIVVYASEEEAKKAQPPDRGGATISFPKEQQWKVPFSTAFATQRELVPTLELPGEVTTPPSGRADVGAPVQGRVVPTSAGLPRPGQAVKKGQVLASIAPTPSSPEEAARANLAVAEATARLEAARSQLARAERLIADQAISQRELEDAQREVAVAEAAVRSSRGTSAMFSGAASGAGAGSYRITSPIHGVLTDVEATAGKSVSAGELLFRVVDLSELWIRARVPEQDALGLQPDDDAAFQLSAGSDWLPIRLRGEGANAALVQFGRVVDPTTRTVDLVYALREPGESLRVGARVRVRAPSGKPWKGVVVPDTAVIDKDGRQIVMVQVEGEAFEERTVTLGPKSGPDVAIARGVENGERVVVRGANVIRLSAQAGQAPAHGHVH